jgi:hypothetical protein
MDRIDVLQFCQARGIPVLSEDGLDSLVYLAATAEKMERERCRGIVEAELETWVGDYKRVVKVCCDNIVDAIKFGEQK